MNDQHHKPLSSYTTPIYDTTALTSALANPYAQHYAQNHMSQHYYQAYMQAYSNAPPRATPEGYTLSSTYVPGMAIKTSRVSSSLPAALDRPSPQTQSNPVIRPIRNHLTYGSWYQPGNCRCTRPGCPFTGSSKSVEIHMMDRHLILPPGRQKRDEWDADPSLKGKPVAIQGTSLVLDTPEAIDDWIAERKRRFPTADRVEDKKRKLEEAAVRGELAPEDIGAGARKKQRWDGPSARGGTKKFRGQGHQRGRGRRLQGMIQRGEPRAEAVDDVTNPTTDAKIGCTREASLKSDSSGDDDEAPEVVSSKAPTVPEEHDVGSGIQLQRPSPQERVKRVSQPKKPPRSSFATRPTLLRNLLLPEIRITVSNLSQAVRFLVDNDFLRDVELRPGEAQERMIEVLESSENPCSTEPSYEKPEPSHEDVDLT